MENNSNHTKTDADKFYVRVDTLAKRLLDDNNSALPVLKELNELIHGQSWLPMNYRASKRQELSKRIRGTILSFLVEI